MTQSEAVPLPPPLLKHIYQRAETRGRQGLPTLNVASDALACAGRALRSVSIYETAIPFSYGAAASVAYLSFVATFGVSADCRTRQLYAATVPQPSLLLFNVGATR